jgi:two-component system sensor histidine kinase/response regulator
MAAARMQVDVAFNGVEAVRMAREGDYDLVLMDIQMPELDGLGATREIRSDPRLRKLPVVAMTAHALASDRAVSRLAGMNDHVTKPIDPDLLFCTLLKWIDPARLAGRTVPPAARPAPAGTAPSAGAIDAAVGALPALPGIDWRLALESVDGNRARLQKRAASFVREYAPAPGILREALAVGDYPCLQTLAHNLKSSAAYVGAVELAGVASRLEQKLRGGQFDTIGVEVPALVAAAETVLAGLARMTADGMPGPADAGAPEGALADVLARLGAYLRSDDARTEDALAQLESLLAAGAHSGKLDAPLAALRRAVADLEYAAALAPLAAMSTQLGTGQTAQPRQTSP